MNLFQSHEFRKKKCFVKRNALFPISAIIPLDSLTNGLMDEYTEREKELVLASVKITSIDYG